MISRRQIRIRVMQAVYAWYCTEYHPGDTFEYNLREFADEIRNFERQKGDKGDSRLLAELFYQTIERRHEFDDMIQQKAENWELDRIALIDRILMQMGICEMLNFEEIPIKVTINEYLEIAKKFSTPKSSKFINGILDSLYLDFKHNGMIQKRGRGLIEETLPKGGRRPRPRRPRQDDGPPRFDNQGPPPPRFRTSDAPPHERGPRTGQRKRIQRNPNPAEMQDKKEFRTPGSEIPPTPIPPAVEEAPELEAPVEATTETPTANETAAEAPVVEAPAEKVSPEETPTADATAESETSDDSEE